METNKMVLVAEPTENLPIEERHNLSIRKIAQNDLLIDMLNAHVLSGDDAMVWHNKIQADEIFRIEKISEAKDETL